jgi:hypothetical protein
MLTCLVTDESQLRSCALLSWFGSIMRGTKPLPNYFCKRSASACLRTEPNTRNPFETSTFVVPQPIPVETPVTTTSLLLAIAFLRRCQGNPGAFSILPSSIRAVCALANGGSYGVTRFAGTNSRAAARCRIPRQTSYPYPRNELPDESHKFAARPHSPGSNCETMTATYRRQCRWLRC